MIVFFFSSRRRHTISLCDWSSDVCSSDLTRCGRPICPECMTPASVGFQCPDDVRAGNAGVRRPRQAPLLQRAGRRFGAVTVTLIALNEVVFVVTAVSAGLAGANPLDNQFSPLFVQLAQIPVLVELGEDWRLVTAAFLHIGVLHLVLNMLALLVFGSELERQLGRWRYLAVYLVSLLGGAVALQLFGEPGRPVAGASAAIYGLLGGLAVMMIARREDLRGLLTLLAINALISFLPGVSDRKSTRLNSSHANISYAVFCLKIKLTLSSVPALLIAIIPMVVRAYV